MKVDIPERPIARPPYIEVEVEIGVSELKANIVGILGRSRAGKDTVASFIAASVPSQTMHIAASLKETLRILYGLSDEQLFGRLKDTCDPRYGYTPRDLCFMFHQNIAKMHGEDFFVNRLFRQYDSLKNKPNIIIPDVRYPHDCEEIRKRNGIIVKIHRTHAPLKLDVEDYIDQMRGDVTVFNTHDVQYLFKQVKTRVLPLLIETQMARRT